MVIQISELVSICKKNNSSELNTAPCSQRVDHIMENPISIMIKNKWFDVIPISKFRSSETEDGYYRAIYIQVNYSTNEYYIGKVNRKRWSEVKRYQGSGLKFSSKYKAHSSEFCRYYIALCNTAEETEKLEADIVDDILLADEKCLNLVRGGGGTSKHINREERSKQQRDYMMNHPGQYESMINKAKELYCSGNTFALEQRNKKIKEKMSDPYYKDLSRERIKKWQVMYPEKYLKSRENNKKALKSKETIEKKQNSFNKWKSENPNKYLENRKKLILSAQTKESKEKRAASIKKWNEQNPEQASLNAKKRTTASVEKCRKAVVMKDLITGEILRQFQSVNEAARWLVDSQIAKSAKCASSISAVCRKAPCTTGYGYRKKAYGYEWDFAEKVDN